MPALVVGTLDGLELQGVEGAAYGLQSRDRHMQIAGGGTEVGVAQQNLYGPEIGAGVEHVGGADVAPMPLPGLCREHQNEPAQSPRNTGGACAPVI